MLINYTHLNWMCQEKSASKMDGLKKHKQAIGDRIRLLRGTISQAEFANRIKTSLPALQRYEYGERIPKGDVLERISVVTGKSVAWILTGEHNFLVDGVAEESSLYHDEVTKKILDMLKGMTVEQKRDALRFIEGQKLLEDREKTIKKG